MSEILAGVRKGGEGGWGRPDIAPIRKENIERSHAKRENCSRTKSVKNKLKSKFKVEKKKWLKKFNINYEQVQIKIWPDLTSLKKQDSCSYIIWEIFKFYMRDFLYKKIYVYTSIYIYYIYKILYKKFFKRFFFLTRDLVFRYSKEILWGKFYVTRWSLSWYYNWSFWFT